MVPVPLDVVPPLLVAESVALGKAPRTTSVEPLPLMASVPMLLDPQTGPPLVTVMVSIVLASGESCGVPEAT